MWLLQNAQTTVHLLHRKYLIVGLVNVSWPFSGHYSTNGTYFSELFYGLYYYVWTLWCWLCFVKGIVLSFWQSSWKIPCIYVHFCERQFHENCLLWNLYWNRDQNKSYFLRYCGRNQMISSMLLLSGYRCLHEKPNNCAKHLLQTSQLHSKQWAEIGITR